MNTEARVAARGAGSMVAIAIVIAPLGLLAQSPATFDVASIKPSAVLNPANPLLTGPRMLLPPDGTVRVTNATLFDLVRFAYNVEPDDVLGASGWQTTSRFDVEGRPSAPGATADDVSRERLRALLAERFKLKAHMESREMTVSALVVASKDGRLGPNLKPTATDCRPDPSTCRTFVTPTPGARGGGPPQMSIRGVGVPLSTLARSVSQAIGAKVVDRTGLLGLYDFETELPLDLQVRTRSLSQAGVPFPADAAQRIEQAADTPAMSTVLQQRLGLKLESQRVAVPVVVIDSAEPPSPN